MKWFHKWRARKQLRAHIARLNRLRDQYGFVVYDESLGNPILDAGGYVINGNTYFSIGLQLGTVAGVAQALAPHLFGGTGVPNNAVGINGDLYFRLDGGAATTLYQRRAGAYVATGA